MPFFGKSYFIMQKNFFLDVLSVGIGNCFYCGYGRRNQLVGGSDLFSLLLASLIWCQLCRCLKKYNMLASQSCNLGGSY